MLTLGYFMNHQFSFETKQLSAAQCALFNAYALNTLNYELNGSWAQGLYRVLTWLLHRELALEFVQTLQSIPSVHLPAFHPHFLNSIQSCIEEIKKRRRRKKLPKAFHIDFYLWKWEIRGRWPMNFGRNQVNQFVNDGNPKLEARSIFDLHYICGWIDSFLLSFRNI